MNKLFIYYSLSGNGDCIAEQLKNKGFAIRSVAPQKKMPKSFFLQILAAASAQASVERSR